MSDQLEVVERCDPHSKEETVMTDDIVKKARNRFDPELHTEAYKKIHNDDEQLDKLTNLFDIIENETYFDLGTGNGYVGFELAKRHKNVFVVGIDIAHNSIDQNNKIAQEEKLSNISFISYEGVKLPFEDEFFQGGVSRYAMHHFPDIIETIKELYRVLKPGGFFVFSDPITYDTDSNNFVDRFQQLKPDGHVHFYRADEIDTLFDENGFAKERSFSSFTTYPRELDGRYRNLLDSEESSLHELYKIKTEGNSIYITVECMNALYRKV